MGHLGTETRSKRFKNAFFKSEPEPLRMLMQVFVANLEPTLNIFRRLTNTWTYLNSSNILQPSPRHCVETQTRAQTRTGGGGDKGRSLLSVGCTIFSVQCPHQLSPNIQSSSGSREYNV